MIAITFALPAESSDLTRRVQQDKIGNVDVEIFHTGVGRQAAHNNIDALLSGRRPELLISSGLAGGVLESLRVGDLI